MDGVADKPPAGWQFAGLLHRGRYFKHWLARPARAGAHSPADYMLKICRMDVEHCTLATALLQHELAICSEVLHPNLMTVLAGQIHDAPAYLVRPFHEGASLRVHLEAGRLRLPEKLWYTRQVAQALAAIHQHGWTHGDIKPDNVIVSPLGHVTLIDLEFARRSRRADGVDPNATNGCDDNSAHAPLLTSLPYAAPELFGATTERCEASDVYSLGIMLYELLTTRRPFDDTDPRHLAWSHVHQPVVDIRYFDASFPTALSLLVHQLLDKVPTARPDATTAAERLLRLEIECFSHERN